jgi:hypothetical protein
VAHLHLPRERADPALSAPPGLILFALATLLLHCLSNGQYGFHRDELATLDDARRVAWAISGIRLPRHSSLAWRSGRLAHGPDAHRRRSGYLPGFPDPGSAVPVCVRRHLASPWLGGGVALSLLVFLPNLAWQLQRHFVALDHLSAIHARDVRIGRTDGFLREQFVVCANPVTIPFWVAAPERLRAH